MLCDNCGKRQANVRYSENINGKKKELNLCEECSHKLGINHMDFSMPIDFSSFFGEFIEDFGTPEILSMPIFDEIKALRCNNCGYTFQDITNTGKLGCGSCYQVFEDRLDPIIRRIQGANRHVGRMGKIIDDKIDKKMEKQASSKKEENLNSVSEQIPKANQLEKLQEQLKQTIKEERYEEAAKLRDEIKKIEKRD